MPYEKIGKNEPVCIADEVPFEIPDSWEWVRLSTICTKLVDGDHNPPKGVQEKTVYIMASSTNINNDMITELDKVRYLSRDVFKKENERTFATKGDIFFTSVGSLGRSCVYEGGLNICFQRSVTVITTLIYNCYLKYCFDSAYIQQKVVREATGTAQKGFYLNQLASVLIPVPPLNEQYRIVSKYLEISPTQKKYEVLNSQIDNLNAIFPDQLKKSILQYAVQGKLVPQDPSDEPASVLLERIRAEKEQLIKAGKIKRDKHESVIIRRDNSHYEKLDGVERCIDDELPFEIPGSWCWCRLGTIAAVLGGKRIPAGRKLTEYNTGHVYIRVSDMTDGGVSTGRLLYVPEDIHPLISRYIINKEDVFITVAGTIGRVGKIPDELDGANLTENADRLVLAGVNQDWLIKVLQSGMIQEQIAEATTQVGQPKLAIVRIEHFLIPLPPLAEQSRIVQRIEELLPLVKEL